MVDYGREKSLEVGQEGCWGCRSQLWLTATLSSLFFTQKRDTRVLIAWSLYAATQESLHITQYTPCCQVSQGASSCILSADGLSLKKAWILLSLGLVLLQVLCTCAPCASNRVGRGTSRGDSMGATRQPWTISEEADRGYCF